MESDVDFRLLIRRAKTTYNCLASRKEFNSVLLMGNQSFYLQIHSRIHYMRVILDFAKEWRVLSEVNIKYLGTHFTNRLW